MKVERYLPTDRAAFAPGGRLAHPIARAVRAGERAYLSAASALRPDGSVAGLGDAAAQTVPGGKSIACSSPAAIAWDASFANAADPSGRAVKGVHEKAL